MAKAIADRLAEVNLLLFAADISKNSHKLNANVEL